MRLATFNLESLGEGPDLDARIASLRPQLQRLRADVLCLQEVNGGRRAGRGPRGLPALEALLAGTPYADFARASTLSDRPASGARDVHNLVVVARWPVRAMRQIRHDFIAPPLVAGPRGGEPAPVTWDRPVLHVELDWAGRPLHVLNLHLRAPIAAPVAGAKSGPFAWTSVTAWAHGFFLAALKRTGQALEARRAVSAIQAAEPEALLAVCGDLNAELNEMPLRTLIAAEEDLGTGALSAESLVPLARGVPLSNRFTVTHMGRPQMLDHILVSRSLLARFRAIEVHNEALADERLAYGRTVDRRGSYHAPVVAEFDDAD